MERIERAFNEVLQRLDATTPQEKSLKSDQRWFISGDNVAFMELDDKD